MLVILVEQRQVEEDVLLVHQHALQAILNDDRDFISVGRIIGNAVRNRRRQDVAMAVLVLQAFAIERRTA